MVEALAMRYLMRSSVRGAMALPQTTLSAAASFAAMLVGTSVPLVAPKVRLDQDAALHRHPRRWCGKWSLLSVRLAAVLATINALLVGYMVLLDRHRTEYAKS